ncbi:unnamed protein product [Bemisia tabaci]|uniref:Transposable element P transposase-like RNase H C-terminal domain-containing protein n=1 Tax=Bemisia tabaci TaxID=7038 RepID=A0A9N9ZZC8_BEMTA|nr:unnamed protein product [Bemisia tabaci]
MINSTATKETIAASDLCETEDDPDDSVFDADRSVGGKPLNPGASRTGLSQHRDHVELFLGLIRAMGGWSNNPPSRHFKAAYKRILCHFKLYKEDNGNCIPQENISILYCSSAFKHPDKMINSTATKETIAASDLCETEDDPNDSVFDADRSAENFWRTAPTSAS